MNKGTIILAVSVVFIFLLLSALMLYNLLFKPQSLPTTDKKLYGDPTPKELRVNYSKLNSVVPGRDTLKKVIDINGAPMSSMSGSLGVYLYFKTPFSDQENIVVLRNNIVLYVLEHVYYNYRGYLSDYFKKYGKPDLHLYNTDGEVFEWDVFLDKGIAIESGGNDITRMLYFVPQKEDLFLSSIAKDIGLSISRIESEDTLPILAP